VIDRSSLGLPPLIATGHVVRLGRKAREFNRYGQPVDLKIKRELFTVGKTIVDNVELRKTL
jgi:hypothetical protein